MWSLKCMLSLIKGCSYFAFQMKFTCWYWQPFRLVWEIRTTRFHLDYQNIIHEMLNNKSQSGIRPHNQISTVPFLIQFLYSSTLVSSYCQHWSFDMPLMIEKEMVLITASLFQRRQCSVGVWCRCGPHWEITVFKGVDMTLHSLLFMFIKSSTVIWLFSLLCSFLMVKVVFHLNQPVIHYTARDSAAQCFAITGDWTLILDWMMLCSC